MSTIKLDLNVKEWIAVYGLLERQSPSQDKHLVEVHNRMKATLAQFIATAVKDQFEKWFDQTSRKVAELDEQNQELIKTPMYRGEVLTDDDEEVVAGDGGNKYPKPGKPSVKPRKRR